MWPAWSSPFDAAQQEAKWQVSQDPVQFPQRSGLTVQGGRGRTSRTSSWKPAVLNWTYRLPEPVGFGQCVWKALQGVRRCLEEPSITFIQSGPIRPAAETSEVILALLDAWKVQTTWMKLALLSVSSAAVWWDGSWITWTIKWCWYQCWQSFTYFIHASLFFFVKLIEIKQLYLLH